VDAKEIRFGAEGSRPAGKDSIKSGAKCIYARLRGRRGMATRAIVCCLPRRKYQRRDSNAHGVPAIANLPELGDGVLHRTIMSVQRLYFDLPDVEGCMPHVSK
jgi:hypothetical protein